MSFRITDRMGTPAEDGWRKCLLNLPAYRDDCRAVCVCDARDGTCKHCRAFDDWVESLAGYIDQLLDRD